MEDAGTTVCTDQCPAPASGSKRFNDISDRRLTILGAFMPSLRCTLGFDREDARLNRPVLVLTSSEVAGLRDPTVLAAAPILAGLVNTADGLTRVAGAGQLPLLRAELRQLLASIAADQLHRQLPHALVLQWFATACVTAQEFGMNLYVVAESEAPDGD